MTGGSGVDPVLGTTPGGATAAGATGYDATGYDATGTTGATSFDAGYDATSTSDDRSLGEIVGDLSHDLTTLVKQELQLARTELKEEAGKAGKGVGMLSGAGVAALLMLIFASGALAYLLDSWIPREVAFLVVAIIWAVVAAVLLSMGRKALKEIQPLPETQQTLKEDAQWAKAQKS